MKRSLTVTCAAVLSIVPLFVGCSDERRVDNLQQQITSLQNETDALKKEIEGLKQQRRFEQLFENFDKIAYLTPGSDGYSTVRFDLGVLTVSFDNVVEYANGSKITLKFGNPLSSTINGLKAKIEYGEVDEKGIPRNQAAKTKEVTFSESLRPGSWTSVSVVLDGVPSSKLGFVRVKEIAHTGISLKTE